MSQLSFDVIKRVWPKSGLTTFLKSTPAYIRGHPFIIGILNLVVRWHDNFIFIREDDSWDGAESACWQMGRILVVQNE